MKGILADANVEGLVDYLVLQMQSEPWSEFWQSLALDYRRFGDVGLSTDSLDSEIWQTCQAEELVLVTNNRNDDGPDSLEATIRAHGTAESLPIFTIADVERFRTDRSTVELVIASLYDYLLRIDEVRGAGRLDLP